MEKYLISGAMRFFFMGSGAVIWIGIWLTGFTTVHWLLYLPATFFTIAAVTGICPGIIFSNALFDNSKDSA